MIKNKLKQLADSISNRFFNLDSDFEDPEIQLQQKTMTEEEQLINDLGASLLRYAPQWTDREFEVMNRRNAYMWKNKK